MQTQANKNGNTITFTIDGRPFTISEKKHAAAHLLRLAGLDPAAYDLVRTRPGQAPEKPYDDEAQVVVHDGDAFLSVRQSAEVA